MVSIYALVDPRDGHIRYIGQTSQSLLTRRNQHVKSPTNDNSRSWIRSMEESGVRPEIILMVRVDNNRANSVEMRMIRKLRKKGFDLLNSYRLVPHNLGPRVTKGAVCKSYKVSRLSARLLDMLADTEQRTNTGYLEWMLKKQAEAQGWDVKKIAKEIAEEESAKTPTVKGTPDA